MDARVPFRIRVGITGHRHLEDPEAISASIHEALESIERLIETTATTRVLITVISPLAEGADRLAALEADRVPGARVEVVLPFPPAEYEKDFESDGSKEEFRALLGKWSRFVTTRAVEPDGEEGQSAGSDDELRTDGYQAVGRYVADRCDVLIAVWDGQPPRGLGGTAEIVDRAVRNEKPVYWIPVNPATGRPAWHPSSETHLPKCVTRLEHDLESTDAFNRAVGSGDTGEDFTERASRAADALAMRFARRYRIGLTATFVLAAMAVVAVAGSSILKQPEWLVTVLEPVEIGSIVLLAVVVLWSRRTEVHEQYLGFRFLAERLREAPYLAAAGVVHTQPTAFTPDFIGYPSEGWPWRVFDELWSAWPRSELRSEDCPAVRERLLTAWFADQRGYHMRTAMEEGRRQHHLERWCLALFVLTAAAAVAHLLDVSPRWTVFASISFGAIGAAVAGYGSQRGHRRHATRSRQMVTFLAHDEECMRSARSPVAIRRAAERAHEHMLAENRAWFGDLLFEEIEIHT